MKVIILYGPGEVGKRAELSRLKKQFSQETISSVDLKQEGVEQLKLELLSVSLFDQNRKLVVGENTPENFDIQAIYQDNPDVTLALIASSPKTTSLLLQSAKAVKAQLLVFEGEKELTAFPFLDSLLERRTEALRELEKLLKEYGAMYILTMIYYGLRRNLLPLPASSFMQGKIKSQKRLYQTNDWQQIYQLTLKTEYGIKNGELEEKAGLVRLIQVILRGYYEGSFY